MITPRKLVAGDVVAVVSPSSAVRAEYIDGAARRLGEAGLGVRVMPHAKGPASGSYAASDTDRLADLTDALRDPEVRAILCARGGYGANHLLPLIDPTLITSDPKWLIGYSDITALHALWQANGVCSLHAPMAKHLTECPADDPCTQALLCILTTGEKVEYSVPAHPLSRPGEASGTLVGGNLAVFNGLAGTPWDPTVVTPDPILVIEDISEAIYAVERMLLRLRMSGLFDRLRGLVAGHFTEYRPDRNHPDMETMIAEVTAGYDFPTALAFPVGHTPDNYPLPLGSRARLTVTHGVERLEFSPSPFTSKL